jgi:hypothetical protein
VSISGQKKSPGISVHQCLSAVQKRALASAFISVYQRFKKEPGHQRSSVSISGQKKSPGISVHQCPSAVKKRALQSAVISG